MGYLHESILDEILQKISQQDKNDLKIRGNSYFECKYESISYHAFKHRVKEVFELNKYQ